MTFEIETSRRSFLIGAGAAVSALMLSPALAGFEGILVKGKIDPRYRKVYDMIVSCDPFPRDVAVNHTIRRDHDILFAMRINARASFRWVAVPGGEMVFTSGDVMRYEVDPCTNGMQMCFHSFDKKEEPFAEFFEWQEDKLTQTDYVRLNRSEPIEDSLAKFKYASRK